MSGDSSPLDVSVLVPVVERHDDLRALHEALARGVDRFSPRTEFLYLVSAEFAEAAKHVQELQARDRRIRLLRFAQPVTEAAALAVGFQRSRGEELLTVPAYFDADPDGLEALHAALEAGADMAFARRVERRSGALKRAQAGLFNRLASLATGTRFEDMASATRAFRREVAQELPLYGEFHRFLPALAHRLGFAVREVAVDEDSRAHPPALYRPRTYFWRALDLLSIFFLSYFTRRPLRLFGSVGAVFGVVGAAILLLVAFQRLVLGVGAADRPILVLGTLLLGLGVQAFTIGLLGELLLFFHAREIPEYRVAEVYETHESPPPPA